MARRATLRGRDPPRPARRERQAAVRFGGGGPQRWKTGEVVAWLTIEEHAADSGVTRPTLTLVHQGTRGGRVGAIRSE
jgi:hypothetical protein